MQMVRMLWQLCPSEIMTILIHFHQSHSRTFKAYYMQHVQRHLTNDFPHLVSYQRFIALIPDILVPMLAYLQSRYGACTGISFIDSTSLEVCDPKRISQHRVFFAPRPMPSVAKPVLDDFTGSSCIWP